MDVLLQDIRFAVRTLLAAPLVSALAIVCLALGIGANATMFSVLDGVLIKPFPFHEPERIVVVTERNRPAGFDDGLMSYLNFRDVREQMHGAVALAAQTGRSLTLGDGVEPVRLEGTIVSWNLFELLGVKPALGRSFRPDEDRQGAPATIILSDDIWRTRYHAEPSLIGRSIIVNGAPATIVGVMPPRFAFPFRSQAWMPIAPIATADSRSDRGLRVYARLAPGATLEQAREELKAIGGRLSAQYAENQGWSITAVTLKEDFIPDQVETVTLSAMGAVSLVLLIACANVANLLMTRATSRHREIAVRAAVGAGRGRILRQLLTESIVLGVVAAPLGLALTFVGLRMLDAGIPDPTLLPYYIGWHLDGRVVTYVTAVAVGTGILFGLAPALETLKTSLVESLKEGARGSSVGGHRGRLRAALVVAEVALSLILLVGAALFVRSFLNLQKASPGFNTGPLLSLRFYLPGEAYAPTGEIAKRVEDVVRRIEGVGGVEAAAASNYVPLNGGGGGGAVLIDSRAFPPGEEPQIGWAMVTPHFFRALGVTLRRGRDFTNTEGLRKSRVAVVNATMAARFWPGKDPVGQRFRMADEKDGDWFTVIGVAPDIARGRVTSRPFPFAFMPYRFDETRNTGIVVRVAGAAPTTVVAAVRAQLRASDSAMPIFGVQSMEEARQRGYWQDRLFVWMFSIFGGIALALAAVGVYGVLAYSVAQRTHEIGVRMALGASGSDVVRMIAVQGVRLAALGIVLGALGAAGVTQGLRSVLFNVSAVDPVSYTTTALFLAAIAVAACWLPAHRATRVDPIIALRAE
jgi:putative ABC transport system permease protein